MKNRLILAMLVTGFSGIVAQILLLRELLVSFSGNELSIGIILANWLILEAFGCFFLGKRIDYIKNKIVAFVGITILFSISLPISIYWTHLLRGILGVSIGERVGFLPTLYSSFLILLPVSVCHAILFTFGCKIYSIFTKSDVPSVSKVYVYETIGTIVGGIIVTIILIPHFHSFQIAIGLALINFFVCLVLIIPLRQAGKLQKIVGAVVAIFLFLSGYFILGGVADKLHRLSVESQWKGHNVVHYQNSIYGNISVIQSEGGEQYTFFLDGIPSITTPIPDIIFVEEFVHLPMLAHPHPEKILILSRGAGGIINEILRHPSVKMVEYAELDPLMMKVLRRFPTPLTETELNDPRVQIKHIDGRLFLKKTPHRYDLILVGLPDPSNLQANRYFTKEFFRLTKERLTEEGILVVSLPSRYALLSEELKNLNACILNTLKSIYPYIRVIPGDNRNLYLSSMSRDISLIEETQLIQRLKERNLKVSILIPRRIEERLHPGWRDWFLESLEGSTRRINKDFQPIGLFYSIAHWNALFSPYLRGLFRWFGKINLPFFLMLLFIFTVVLLGRRSKTTNIGIPMCITTTGFAGMLFELVLIFAFQALYGYVFHWLGLLVAAFMAGIVVGGAAMTSLLARIKQDLTFFIKLEVAIILFSGMLPLIFLFFHPYLGRPAVFILLQVAFLVLSLLSGLLVGAQFPLANKIYLTQGTRAQRPNLSRTAGLLYGADLFGGWLGGIVGGVILLPVLGLFGTCMVVVMLKVSSLIILVTTSIKGYQLHL
ncbi:spermine synthase [candidate division NPL-UPA2 bacterium]|nr:spermine synthase [candidate division NPL-UPA2 bacterium]